MKVKFVRWTWPWQKSNSIMGRFGGGWNFNLGIQVGGTTVLLNLIWGSIRITFKEKKNA